jgi:hypothetical protein
MHASNPNASRPILKLKPGSKKSRNEATATATRQYSKLAHEPGALWSVDLMRQMQEDMNALKLRSNGGK